MSGYQTEISSGGAIQIGASQQEQPRPAVTSGYNQGKQLQFKGWDREQNMKNSLQQPQTNGKGKEPVSWQLQGFQGGVQDKLSNQKEDCRDGKEKLNAT